MEKEANKYFNDLLNDNIGRIANAMEEQSITLDDNLVRIADAMEEILRLVKEDQEQYKKKPKSKIEESLIKQNYK